MRRGREVAVRAMSIEEVDHSITRGKGQAGTPGIANSKFQG